MRTVNVVHITDQIKDWIEVTSLERSEFEKQPLAGQIADFRPLSEILDAHPTFSPVARQEFEKFASKPESHDILEALLTWALNRGMEELLTLT
jgi:hypothetical protein